MQTIQTLEGISTNELLEAFNLSFSDYIIPVTLSKEQLEEKIRIESVQLDLSVGAFRNERLIALILHGLDVIDGERVAYNSGTGVIPDERGNHLTEKLYSYVLPKLRSRDISKVQLEVIVENERAVRAYEKIGFQRKRELVCLKGMLNVTDTSDVSDVRIIEENDREKFRSFWDFVPAWQNSITAAEKSENQCVTYGIYSEDDLQAYVICNPNAKRILQIAVNKEHRRRGLGRRLFSFFSSEHSNKVSMINIDNSSNETMKFLSAMGLKEFIKQYEMELMIRQ
jgi:ribosomal protein S18 acetylase RimI-like enzyme